jgi:hypothetical protein
MKRAPKTWFVDHGRDAAVSYAAEGAGRFRLSLFLLVVFLIQVLVFPVDIYRSMRRRKI